MKPAIAAVGLALLVALPAVTAKAKSPTPVAIGHALEMAAANNIAMPRSFWRSDNGQWSGVAGYGTDGSWYEIVLDAQGNLVRTGHDDGKSFPVTLAQAAETAAQNGLTQIDTLRLGGGAWFAMGSDQAGTSQWLVIDATSGAVVKKGAS